MTDLLAVGRLGESPGQQHVGDERHHDRDDRDAAEHHHHPPQPKPDRLAEEVEVAVADGGQRLGGEGQRVHPADAGLVGESQDEGRAEQQCHRDGQGAVEQRVHVLVERPGRVEGPDSRRAVHRGTVGPGTHRETPSPEFLSASHDRGLVALVHLLVEAGAGDHVAGVR